LKVDGVSGHILGQQQFVELCFILNVKYRQIGDCWDKGLFDYKRLFGKFRGTADSNNKGLWETLEYELKWPFFKIKDDLTIEENMSRVRSFFQALTGVGLSVVEGNHRMTLAGKLMYGQHIEDTIPRGQFSEKFVHPPDYSPLRREIKVQILSLQNMTKDTNNILKQSQLNLLRTKSHKAAEDKNRCIPASWKDWLTRGVQVVTTNQAFVQEREFINLKTIKSPYKIYRDEDAFLAQNILRRKLIGNLFCNEQPAKNILEIGSYKETRMAHSLQFDTVKFLENYVRNTKPCDYLNRGAFSNVSQMETPESTLSNQS
jgi:hypothetical protein